LKVATAELKPAACSFVAVPDRLKRSGYDRVPHLGRHWCALLATGSPAFIASVITAPLWDGNFLRALAETVLQILMEADVEGVMQV
jgi:hypothetical protein